MRLLLGTLVVEIHQVREELLIGHVMRQAIRVQNRLVELVVQFLEDANEALVVNCSVLGRQRFACPQFLEHVVEARHGEGWVRGQLLFAVCVELFGEVADVRLLVGVGFWEGEGLEAAGLVVAGVVANPEAPARCKGPSYVSPTR